MGVGGMLDRREPDKGVLDRKEPNWGCLVLDRREPDKGGARQERAHWGGDTNPVDAIGDILWRIVFLQFELLNIIQDLV